MARPGYQRSSRQRFGLDEALHERKRNPSSMSCPLGQYASYQPTEVSRCAERAALSRRSVGM